MRIKFGTSKPKFNKRQEKRLEIITKMRRMISITNKTVMQSEAEVL